MGNAVFVNQNGPNRRAYRWKRAKMGETINYRKNKK